MMDLPFSASTSACRSLKRRISIWPQDCDVFPGEAASGHRPGLPGPPHDTDLPDQIGDLLVERAIFRAAEHHQHVGQPEQRPSLLLPEDRQSVLAAGGGNGVRLMSEAGRERVLETQFDGVDAVMGVPIRWGLGYALGLGYPLGSPVDGLDFGPRVAYWGGNGGSMALVDLDHRTSFGHVPSRWIRGSYELERSRLPLQAVYESLNAR
jgi:hypothetical protein